MIAPGFLNIIRTVRNIMKDVYEVPAGPKDRLYPSIKKHLIFKEMWSMVGDVRKVMKI